MANTALVVMDVQPSILERYGDNTEQYLETVQRTVAAARQAGMPVIFVVVGFRPGFPEVSSNNKGFSTIRDRADAGMINPQPALPVEQGDIVVTKRRISAFAGSDLEVVLRGQGATHMVLCGIATSGVVLSTVREAADKDYQLTVLSDLCLDGDEEDHRVLTAKVFPHQATVATSEAWVTSFTEGKKA